MPQTLKSKSDDSLMQWQGKVTDISVWHMRRCRVFLVHAKAKCGVEARFTFVQNAGMASISYLVNREIWRGTWWPTAEKEPKLVSNATSHLMWLALWKRICAPIVEWRTTLAQNVVSHLVNQDTWGATWSPTLGKKYTNVQNAVIHLVWLNA